MGHYLLLVTTSAGTDSLSVRRYVTAELEADPTFVGGQPEGYRFAIVSAVCDYFGVGGTFTGLLIGEEEARDPNWEAFGDECDALLITEELYDRLLTEFEGREAHDNNFVDLEGEVVDRHFIGRKWLCVVDYHQ